VAPAANGRFVTFRTDAEAVFLPDIQRMRNQVIRISSFD